MSCVPGPGTSIESRVQLKPPAAALVLHVCCEPTCCLQSCWKLLDNSGFSSCIVSYSCTQLLACRCVYKLISCCPPNDLKLCICMQLTYIHCCLDVCYSCIHTLIYNMLPRCVFALLVFAVLKPGYQIKTFAADANYPNATRLCGWKRFCPDSFAVRLPAERNRFTGDILCPNGRFTEGLGAQSMDQCCEWCIAHIRNFRIFKEPKMPHHTVKQNPCWNPDTMCTWSFLYTCAQCTAVSRCRMHNRPPYKSQRFTLPIWSLYKV